MANKLDILFMDNARQAEIEMFYDDTNKYLNFCMKSPQIVHIDTDAWANSFRRASQRYRDYYRGHGKAYHPLIYFKDPVYAYQCPPEMTETYLSFPAYHVKYKQPVVLAQTTGRTSGFPSLPDRTLAGRYNKAACKLFVR